MGGELDTVKGFSQEVITNPEKLSKFNILDFSDTMDNTIKYVDGNCNFDQYIMEN
jgi:hypothetical protein